MNWGKLVPLGQSEKETYAFLFWGFTAVVITLKLFQGDYSFYEFHFGANYQDQAVLNWHKWLYHHLSSFFLWFILPLLFLKLNGKNARDFGVGLGDWKFGLRFLLVALIVMPFPVYLTSLDEAHRAWYPLTTLALQSTSLFALWGLSYLPHYVGWEFFFRGFLAFELKNKFSYALGIFIPTILTVLMHIGKPQGETWGALLGGVLLGWVCFRSKSIWYVVFFHWYLGMLNTYFCGTYELN